MNIGRGYHSQLLLTDGTVFTLGGSWMGGIGGKTGEVYSPTTETWTLKPGIASNGSLLTDDFEVSVLR